MMDGVLSRQSMYPFALFLSLYLFHVVCVVY